MGWNEGQGLGRQGHGRTEPIEVIYNRGKIERLIGLKLLTNIFQIIYIFNTYVLLQAQRRQAQAGLGSTGSRIVGDPNDSYRDAGKKMMYSRYKDL